MPHRLIAIGDIHGYAAALRTLIDAIDPQPDDTLAPLGDFIDRGPDSPGTLDALIALRERCRLVPILGNHDEMLLRLYGGEPGLADWLAYGGFETLRAYGRRDPRDIPECHIAFLRSCLPYFEADGHFFVHASYLPAAPLEEQPAEVLRWPSIRSAPPGPHVSGKIAVVGHTAQKDGRILDLGHLVCIDTCCYGNKWLTAMEFPSRRVWQATPDGRLL